MEYAWSCESSTVNRIKRQGMGTWLSLEGDRLRLRGTQLSLLLVGGGGDASASSSRYAGVFLAIKKDVKRNIGNGAAGSRTAYLRCEVR